jgi:hypothetical protein
MSELLGEKLLEKKVVTEAQLKEALQRQRLQGGRLGHNLVALGYISSEELGIFFKRHPSPPHTIEETGLDTTFITNLILKHCNLLGEFTIQDMVQSVKLSPQVVDTIFEILRHEKMIDVKKATGYTKSTYTYAVTVPGQHRAAELLDVCRYVGPAPVTLDAYVNMAEIQTIKNIVVSEPSLKSAFEHIIIDDRMLNRLGPATSSGKAIFLYGPPGNGKTTIAETLGKFIFVARL